MRIAIIAIPIPIGFEHPTYAVWAEVHASGSGSKTKYHRALQIRHGRIDRAVKECQGNNLR